MSHKHRLVRGKKVRDDLRSDMPCWCVDVASILPVATKRSKYAAPKPRTDAQWNPGRILEGAPPNDTIPVGFVFDFLCHSAPSLSQLEPGRHRNAC